MQTFTSQEIYDLKCICDWLSNQPCKSANSEDINAKFFNAKYWISFAWKDRRRQASVLYYQVGYGWRLNKAWKQNIEKLMVQNHA